MTATEVAVAQDDADEVVEVVEADLVEVDVEVERVLPIEVEVLVELTTLELDEEPDPEPEMAMSAQVRYTWPVWKEFHLSDSRV